MKEKGDPLKPKSESPRKAIHLSRNGLSNNYLADQDRNVQKNRIKQKL